MAVDEHARCDVECSFGDGKLFSVKGGVWAKMEVTHCAGGEW